jgi:hypothetical protein
MSEPKLYEDGLESYPKGVVISGNLLMVAWIAAGTIGCWFLNPFIAWIYLAFALIMVALVLRKLVCRGCYYHGRCCALGWGKLAALISKREDISKFGTGAGPKLAPLTYGLLILIPVITIIIFFFTDGGLIAQKITVLVILFFSGAYSGAISRKSTCAQCKMRFICSGSAAK